jgi:hypothetical protein
VLRQTIRQRWQAKLRAVKTELRQRPHAPIPAPGAYLRSVVVGHTRYYGVPRKRAEPQRGPGRARPTLARRAAAPESDRVRVVVADAPPRGALAPWAAHVQRCLS